MNSLDKKAGRRPGRAKPVAIIDIGSNSVRLVVYEGAKRSPAPLFNEKVLCGLGRSLATTGQLHQKGAKRALLALRRFRAIANQLGASKLHVIATAAAREAKNGPEFIAHAQEICGDSISVLSGRKEAKLAAYGVMAGNHETDGLAADLGGGSLEIINIRKQRLAEGITLPLGGLRLIDVSEGNLGKAAKLIDKALDGLDWLHEGEGRPFYGIGGTWRAFARLHMAHTSYPLSVIHGYEISLEEALDFARLLNHLSSPRSLGGINEISKARRETIPYGALVLERLLQRVQPSCFTVSAFGVREGLFHTLLSDKERCRDPLLAACEELAIQRSRSPAHAWELCDWTSALFQGSGLSETPEQKRLRQAACLLSDIGWRSHPDYRGEQSLNLVAHASFSGIDHPGRTFLAMTVFYRHQGLIDAEAGPRLRELVDAVTDKRARIMGAALRTAHMISASMTGVISQTPISRIENRLVLHIPESLTALNGERLERRFGVLARELGLEPEISINDMAVTKPAKVSV